MEKAEFIPFPVSSRNSRSPKAPFSAGRKTLYNLQIPAAVFGVASLEPGQVHGFSLLVNSSDGLIRDGFLAWGEGIGNGKFPGMYNQLKIE